MIIINLIWKLYHILQTRCLQFTVSIAKFTKRIVSKVLLQNCQIYVMLTRSMLAMSTFQITKRQKNSTEKFFQDSVSCKTLKIVKFPDPS